MVKNEKKGDDIDIFDPAEKLKEGPDCCSAVIQVLVYLLSVVIFYNFGWRNPDLNSDIKHYDCWVKPVSYIC